MTRASTPLDPLEPIAQLEVNNSIPPSNQPWLSVGQIVLGVTWHHSSFYLKELLKNKTRSRTNFLRSNANGND